MRRLTRFIPVIARILLGLIFFIAGLNGFLNFIPPPESSLPEPAAAFLDALLKTGYMLSLVAGTQLVSGLLLLLNRFVPLALALLAPVIVGIIGFHIFLEPSGMPMAIVVLVLEIYLAWIYREAFRPMLRMRVDPH